MGSKLAPHLSFKSALVLLPPRHISSVINTTRRKYDKSFDRWMPHINLIYPFRAAPSVLVTQGQGGTVQLKEDLRARIADATKSVRPFTTSLALEVGAFTHNPKNISVWLSPTTNRVKELQAALRFEFTECIRNTRPFVPHLTIGRARNCQGISLIGEDIKKAHETSRAMGAGHVPSTQSWTVDKVFVIERDDYLGSFKVIDTVPLLVK